MLVKLIHVAEMGSISPIFNKQVLFKQIPKVQKDSELKQLFALLGSAGVKALHKHIDETGPWGREKPLL